MQPKTSSSRLAEEPGKSEKKAGKYLCILCECECGYFIYPRIVE